jgi:hypothetical protein
VWVKFDDQAHHHVELLTGSLFIKVRICLLTRT